MTLEIELSEEKTELLGLAIVKMFRLKLNKNGQYSTGLGEMTLKCVANSVLLTVGETTQYEASKLKEMLDTGWAWLLPD